MHNELKLFSLYHFTFSNFIQTELFQDDLFPPTRVIWSETISSNDWLDNKNKQPLRVSLQPDGMDCLSSNVVTTTQIVSKNDNNETTYLASQLSPEHAKSKQDAIKKSVSERVILNYELEQDTMEGVDSKEWDE